MFHLEIMNFKNACVPNFSFSVIAHGWAGLIRGRENATREIELKLVNRNDSGQESQERPFYISTIYFGFVTTIHISKLNNF